MRTYYSATNANKKAELLSVYLQLRLQNHPEVVIMRRNCVSVHKGQVSTEGTVLKMAREFITDIELFMVSSIINYLNVC